MMKQKVSLPAAVFFRRKENLASTFYNVSVDELKLVDNLIYKKTKPQYAGETQIKAAFKDGTRAE